MMLRPRKQEPRPTLMSFAYWVVTNRLALAVTEMAAIVLGVGIAFEMCLQDQGYCASGAEIEISTVVWMIFIGLVSGLVIGWRRAFYDGQLD